jgi:hypothetical protein
MLGETPIFDANDIGGNERRTASVAREASVNDDGVALGGPPGLPKRR